MAIESADVYWHSLKGSTNEPDLPRTVWERKLMRRLLMMTALLLTAGLVIAQTDANQSSASQSSSQTSNANETKIQGCLSGSDGNYTLTDASGTTYQLTGDTAKLSEHVGHEVELTGTQSSASSSSSSASSGQTGTSNQASFSVSAVRHISKTCSSGGTSH